MASQTKQKQTRITEFNQQYSYCQMFDIQYWKDSQMHNQIYTHIHSVMADMSLFNRD